MEKKDGVCATDRTDESQQGIQALALLCHRTKNLYNRAVHIMNGQLEQGGAVLTYLDLDWILKEENVYRILPAHTAQQTLRLLLRNWKSFFEARKGYKQHPERFLGKTQPPKYKRRDGHTIAIISNQQAHITNGRLVLPKKIGFTTLTRLPSTCKLREVRIIPQHSCYVVEIVYLRKLQRKMNRTPLRVGAIDLGLTNLITFVDNLGNRPLVVKDEGKGIKSVTQYYLKRISQLQEKYAQQQRKRLKQKKRLRYGPSYYRVKATWQRKCWNELHQLTRYLVDIWIERDLDVVYIGYNPTWKQEIRLRKKTTQLFVIIPFERMIKLLTYKAAEKGITVETVPEAYTSKCSFLDNEPIKKHQAYKGKRVKRGGFRTSTGLLWNADVNAAYNILIKSEPYALPPRSAGGVGGYVIYPFLVSEKQWQFPLLFHHDLDK